LSFREEQGIPSFRQLVALQSLVRKILADLVILRSVWPARYPHSITHAVVGSRPQERDAFFRIQEQLRKSCSSSDYMKGESIIPLAIEFKRRNERSSPLVEVSFTAMSLKARVLFLIQLLGIPANARRVCTCAKCGSYVFDAFGDYLGKKTAKPLCPTHRAVRKPHNPV
jgi:hypothetical protein